MEPSSNPAAPASPSLPERAKAADDKIALLSALLHRLEETAQNDGLAENTTPDAHLTQLVKSRLGIASSLFAALRAKHPATAHHCFRVALGVSAWGAARKLPSEQRDATEIAALLHDIGKLGVPDVVLAKPCKLSTEELLAMERSRLVGTEILSGCCATPQIHEIMLNVGAWYDGTRHGYDRHGEQLPVGSRMIAIVDAFDSMTTEHVYRQAMSRERALAELCEFAGTQFDPHLVKEFCGLVTHDFSHLQKVVARRWLRELDPEQSDRNWTLCPPLVSRQPERPDGPFLVRLVESLPDGVAFVDDQLRVHRWNPAMERITGLQAEGVLDKQWTPGLVKLRSEQGKLVADPECPVLQAIRTGSTIRRRQLLSSRKSERVTVDLYVFPVLGTDGAPQGETLLIHDASSQMSLEERVQTLHEKASRDQLTKAANRAEFNRVLPEFIDTHLQQVRPCTMIICDIDHFKKINDTFGHPAGDEALVQFAAVLLRHARTGDLVARYGGEEFVLLCADCDNATATRRAEEIRRKVAETPLPALNNKCITASFGVTEIQAGDSPETFLNRADRALLQAKDSGRNMVVQLGSGFAQETRPEESGGWFSWFGGPAGETLLERTLVTAVPLKVTAEKLRGFVADHNAQLNKVDENRITLTIDGQSIPLLRRVSDRAVPFQIELAFEEKSLPIEGRGQQSALRTLIRVTIRPKRQRDRRRRDAIERARQLLFSLQSYLIAQDYLGPTETRVEPERAGLLRSSQRALSQWLGM